MQRNNNYKLHTHNHYNYLVQGMSKKKKRILEEYCRIKVVTKCLSQRPHVRVHEALSSDTLILYLTFFYIFH